MTLLTYTVLPGSLLGIAQSHQKICVERMSDWGFPGGAVVKNPPANARDTGLSPGPGRSHMLRSSQASVPQLLSLRSGAREPQLLSPRATTTEPTCLEPVLCNKRSHRNEKLTHRNEE